MSILITHITNIYIYKFDVIIGFLDLENIDIDTKTISLTSILRELWQIIEFHGGHFVFHPYILCIYNKSDVTFGFLDLENIGIDT